jgi:hypothetical protein
MDRNLHDGNLWISHYVTKTSGFLVLTPDSFVPLLNSILGRSEAS